MLDIDPARLNRIRPRRPIGCELRRQDRQQPLLNLVIGRVEFELVAAPQAKPGDYVFGDRFVEAYCSLLIRLHSRRQPFSPQHRQCSRQLQDTWQLSKTQPSNSSPDMRQEPKMLFRFERYVLPTTRLIAPPAPMPMDLSPLASAYHTLRSPTLLAHLIPERFARRAPEGHAAPLSLLIQFDRFEAEEMRAT